MPAYGSRRNNYSNRAGIQPFTGRGRSLGGFRATPSILRGLSNLAGATGLVGGTLGGAVTGRRYLKAKVSRMLAERRNTSSIQQGKVINEGTGGQYSSFTGPSGKSYLPDHVENALAPICLVTNSAAQLKSGVGIQQVATVGSLFAPILGTTYTADTISRVIYDKATLDVTMNNIYLSNCYVIIYDIMCRKDVGSSAINNPLSAWIQGDVDESATSAYTKLGSTPWQSDVFNQFYSVKQVTNVVLGAGATHVHKVRMSPKRLIPGSYGTYSPYGFKDLTYFCIVEIHGSPANDTVTQTQVSIGSGGLNYVSDKEEHIKQLENSTPKIVVTNNLIGAFTTAEQVVNLGGSTIVPQAEG